MCFSPKIPKDNSGDIARQQEIERQQRITQGTANIDQVFTPYNNDYFQGLTSDYLSHYTPDLERQKTEALRKLTLGLARTGNLTGSVGQNKLQDLDRLYGTNKQMIADQGLAAASDARARMEAARNDLYAQNRAAADPASAGASAAAQASNIFRAPVYNPLGDVFASLLNSQANAIGATMAGYPQRDTGLWFNPNGSSRVIG